MTGKDETYIEARAAQIKAILPGLQAERDRLLAASDSPLTRRIIGTRGKDVLGRQAAGINKDIEGLKV